VLNTVNLTFADYARGGFWQLLVVTLLTLLVIAIAVRKAPRVTAADRLAVRLLLGALVVGALTVVASALWRMMVYEQAYGFTRLRVFVSAFELWLGVVFLLVLIAGIRLGGSWLPQLVVGTWVLTLLGLVLLNPDRFIAAQNVDRYEQTNKLDLLYLRSLSPDAAPELDRLPDKYRACALRGIKQQLANEPDDWRGFNVARHRAERIVRDVRPDSSCAIAY
jgi:hypothetical protein